MTYPVSDAQDCPFDRVWIEVNVSGGRAGQPKGSITIHNDNLAWQGRKPCEAHH